MADLSITAANVIADSSARLRTGTACATITAGQIVYLDPTDNRYKLADCDSATAAVRSPAGMALHGALSGQPLTIAEGGPVALGAILTAGVAYYLSPTAGGVCPVADLSAGDYPTILGIASSTSVLKLRIHEAGAVLA